MKCHFITIDTKVLSSLLKKCGKYIESNEDEFNDEINELRDNVMKLDCNINNNKNHIRLTQFIINNS